MAHIYEKVKDDILTKIHDGTYKAGSRLPAERTLADNYNVSRMTVRQAINALVLEGILERKQGSGTYVMSAQFKQRNVRSFTETVSAQGFKPSTKVLEFSRVHHIKPIHEILGYPEEAVFYKLKRVRYGNDIPIAMETVYFPVDKCPGLETFSGDQSLYQVLKERFGYSVSQLSYDIDACISSRMMMKYFEVSNKIALLRMTGISYVEGDEPFMYEESFYRSELYKYKVDIYRR